MAHRDVVCLPQLRLGGGTLINEYDAIYSARAAAATTATSHCLQYWLIDWLIAPVAQERCRISPSRFLAECRKRRLNQASFVLLFFALFPFSGLCLVCVMSVFLICFLSCIFWREPTWMALYGLIVLICNYESTHLLTHSFIHSFTHSLTDWFIDWLADWLLLLLILMLSLLLLDWLSIISFFAKKNLSYYLASTLWNRLHQCPLINVVLMVVIMILIITIKVLLSWHTCCESVLGSSDECRLSTKQPPTLRPCQPTWAVSSPVGCCRLYSLSPFIILTQSKSWSLISPSHGG